MRNAGSLTSRAHEPHEPTGIYDLTPFTMLDYPGHLAAIVWFAGCNMRCDYCYNGDIVFAEGKRKREEVLAFLQRRSGLLDGVVLSGGEATLYRELPEFCRHVKQLGYAVKLDTNGLNHDAVATLVNAGLVDTVALDYKAPRPKFQAITHNRHFEAFEKTLDFLIGSSLDFEVRTTVHTDLIDEADVGAIIDDLWERGYRGTYYVQEYRADAPTIGSIRPPLRRFDLPRFADAKLNVVYRD
jgi:pyruvate formate lyase activating enzyme